MDAALVCILRDTLALMLVLDSRGLRALSGMV